MNWRCLFGHKRRNRAKVSATHVICASLLYGGMPIESRRVEAWTVECDRCDQAWLRAVGDNRFQRIEKSDLAVFERDTFARVYGKVPA